MELKKSSFKVSALIVLYLTMKLVDKIGFSNIPIGFGIVLFTITIVVFIVQNIRYSYKSEEEISKGQLRYFRILTIGMSIVFTIFMSIMILEKYNITLYKKYMNLLFGVMGLIVIITLILSFSCLYQNYKNDKLKNKAIEKEKSKKRVTTKR